jgi:hypothetical protein
MHSRVLYLALADGRGHLMRAHLLASALRAWGVEVQLVTTRDEGARFLEALGHDDVHTLPGGFHVPYSGPDLDMRAAARDIRAYLSHPRRYARDIRHLAMMSRGALIVNDSFHPAATWLSMTRRRSVLFVHAEHVRRVTFARLPRHARRLMKVALKRAWVVEASLDPTGADQLQPLTAKPRRWGAPRLEGERRAAVYLNPNLADVARARAIRSALEAQGYEVAGVGPAAAGLDPVNPRLVDVIADSDVLVAGPGAASCAQAVAFDIPLIALLGDQPEQRANAGVLEARGHPVFPASVHDDVGASVAACARAARSVPGRLSFEARAARVDAIHRAWTQRVLALLQEMNHAHRPRPRDAQPPLAA